MEHRVGKDCGDEGVQRVFTVQCPREGVVLLCEFCEWLCDVCIMWDEWLLVAKDAQYAANFFNCFEFTQPVS